MIREFDYNSITLQNIADNEHLEFVCDGDKQKVVVNSIGGTLFFQGDTGEWKVIGAAIIEGLKVGIDMGIPEDDKTVQTTISLTPKYKKWYKKRKGKRYVYDYKWEIGFDPKVIKKLLGGE